MSVPAKVRQMARECVAVRTRLLNRLVTGVCDAGLRPYGVRVAQVNILCAIANSGPLTPTDLAAVLVLEKSTLSRDMAKLLEKGWVETQPGDDARSHRLAATPAGVAFLEGIHPVWSEAQKQLVKRLGPVLVAAMTETVDEIWAEQSPGEQGA
ncbi:MAG: MarR family transcriptional regulator [Fimbriiglobus sp.]|nr:MarR family transcriptional regulator [Fimbriiglobus sp.]